MRGVPSPAGTSTAQWTSGCGARGVAGATLAEAANVAITAAQFGGRCGYWRAVGWIGARLRWATGHHAGLSPAARGEAVDQLIGTSVAGT